MSLFQQMEEGAYEQVVFCQDEQAGLRAIIVVHDTTLGPALGGARMWPYETEEEALEDALRLAKGMTYKNAAAGVNLGGGKAVIIGNPKKDKTEALFRAFGRYVESLNGRYITSADVGTGSDDLDFVFQETDHLVGNASSANTSGDPSPVTSYGIYMGMKASAKEKYGSDHLKGKTVAVQGAGSVASKLCEYLHEEGASIIITDIFDEAADRIVKLYDAKKVAPEDIYAVDADIFAPCALGAILNDETIPQLKVDIVAGSANNQLAEPRHGDLLEERNILYAPDYVINAGGVLNVVEEMKGYNRKRAMRSVESIYDTMLELYALAREKEIPTYQAADELAERRMEMGAQLKRTFLPTEKYTHPHHE